MVWRNGAGSILFMEARTMQPVKIRILSTTKDEGSEAQASEQKYTGMMTEKGGKYYVIYKEDEQSGLDNTKTTLKWDDEHVIVMRSGSFDVSTPISRQVSPI